MIYISLSWKLINTARHKCKSYYITSLPRYVKIKSCGNVNTKNRNLYNLLIYSCAYPLFKTLNALNYNSNLILNYLTVVLVN